MNEKKIEIIADALKVYMQFGVKSVTMDEMARQLGVSKKTLYVYFTDKNDLVESCLMYALECDLKEIKSVFSEEKNAIEELMIMSKMVMNQLSQVHPSVFFDLKKYHPKSLTLVRGKKDSGVRDLIKENLQKGIEQGVYRENLKPDILSNIHMILMEHLIANDFGDGTDFQPDEVYSEFFRYHIRGIASKNGLLYLKELIKNEENL